MLNEMSPETRDFALNALNELSDTMLKTAEDAREEARITQDDFQRRVIAGIGMLAAGLALVADVLAHNPPKKETK